MKQIVLKLTRKDFRWTYFNGTGSGGQNRNKTANCVRLFHDPSGASAVAQGERSKKQNEQDAFERLCKTDIFQKWIRAESMKRSGELAIVEANVKKQLAESIVEVQDESGKWVPSKDLQPNHYDVENAFEK